MAFLKGAWSVLVGIKDALVLIFMLLFFITLLGVLSNRPNPASVQEGALLLNLDGIIVEEKSQVDPLQLLTSGSEPIKEFRLRDVVRAIESSVEDDDVKAVVLDLDRFLGAGQSSIATIGDALDKVRKSGKPVYSFATAYSDSGYLLAAHASEIWMDPQGGVLVAGPGGSRLYYKNLIDRLKVTAHIYKVGTYKSAVEPYARADQSEEAAQALKAVYDALWDQYLTDVQTARPTAKLKEFIDNPSEVAIAAGGDLAKIATEKKLIDKLGDRVAFGEAIAETVGVDEEKRPGSFKKTNLAVWLAANPAPASGDAIGVITIAGTIVDGKAGPGVAAGGRIAEQLYDGLANKDLKALVVRVDSPGGSVTASEQIRLAIERYKERDIPVVVSMGDVAASGGYWVSTPGATIFAEPSTITGSIGIFAVIPSFERAISDIGINADGVQTTPLSGQPDLFGGFNESVNTILQTNVENGYDDFLTRVSKSRKMSKESVDKVGQGRIWDGGTANQLKLVDRLGGMDEALAEAAKLAKLDGDYYASYLEPTPDPIAEFISSFMKGDAPQGEHQTGYDVFARLSLSQQASAGQMIHDLKRLVSVQGVQAECLECAALHSDYRAAEEAKGWFAKLLVRAGLTD